MPGVNGYRGDGYPGGGPYPGPSSGYPARSDGYDPYNRGAPPDGRPGREDPYNYSRPPPRDSYAGRNEDPYSTRIPGPADDHYGRYGKPEDPYSARRPEDPYSQHRKPESPYAARKPDSPYAARKPDSPYAARKPEDPYRYDRRPVEDPYSRVHKDRNHNGAGPQDDYRPHSHEADGASSPHYEMDHLATFSVGGKQGLMSPTDGIRKLRQMELSTGIWTMRVTLVIEPTNLIIIDRATGEDMERFPMSYITQPTAVTNEDRRDVYNNIVLFTVTEDTRRGASSEMHMFQCIGRPAHEVVDDMKAAKAGKPRGPAPSREREHARHSGEPVNERVMEFEKHAQHNFNANRDYHQAVPSSQLLRQSMHHDDNESVLSERTDHDVPKEEAAHSDKPEKDDYENIPIPACQQLLNHCFDDIEKFVGRLQSAAESYRELAARRRQRESTKKNKHPIGDGMLSMRSRPPPASDFIDVFQKFKLSFNLLAKLKPHIHDPNAPELVHFLFTPLSLVVEASKDPRHGTPDIASKVLSPMLTADAKELLMNCLSSKETDLWHSLGDAWRLSRDEYKDYVPAYYPRFSDGWEPPRSWNTEGGHAEPPRRHDDENPYSRNGHSQVHDQPYKDDPYDRTTQPDAHARALAEYEEEYRRRERRREADHSRDDRGRDDRGRDDRGRNDRTNEMERQRALEQEREFNRPPEPRGPLTFEEKQQEFLRELRSKNARAAEAKHTRDGKNPKELTIQKGEIVEVMDSSRNWWKVRNNSNQAGHVPFTILDEISNTGPIRDTVYQNDDVQHRKPSSETDPYINVPTPYSPKDGSSPPPTNHSPQTKGNPHVTERYHDDERRYSWQPGDPYYRGDKNRQSDHPRDDLLDRSRSTDEPQNDYINVDAVHVDKRENTYDNDRKRKTQYEAKSAFEFPGHSSPVSGHKFQEPAVTSPARASRYHEPRSPERNESQKRRPRSRSLERRESQRRPRSRSPERRESQHRRPRSRSPERHDSLNRRPKSRSPESRTRQNHRASDRTDSRYREPERPDTRYHDPRSRSRERSGSRYQEPRPRTPEYRDRPYSKRDSAYQSPKSSDRLPVHNIARNPLMENITGELKGLNQYQGGPISPKPLSPKPRASELYLNLHSNRDDVQRWLASKGYTRRLQHSLNGYDGRDMFELRSSQIHDLARDEARSLESQLTVQRNIAGYAIDKSRELDAVLRGRKEDVESM